MFLSPISFGKKIPIANCEIKDLQSNKYTKATFAKYDCSDYSDIREMEQIPDNWKFKKNIISKMKSVYLTKDFMPSSTSFYVLENNKDGIVGIAQIRNLYPDLFLDYIESEPDKKYKYVGQSIMAFLCKIALDNNLKRIYIPNAIESARDFYIKKCKFKESDKNAPLMLAQRGMRNYLKSHPVDY